MGYFSYVLHSCYRDMLKSGRKGGPSQALFDVHHLVTIGLVAMSFHFNGYRAGALTRLIHDVADIVLYSSKLRQAIYETRGGDPGRLNKWFYAIIASWGSTRIALYGYFCMRIHVMVFRFLPRMQNIPQRPLQLMMIGSWIMLVLQVAFYKGIVGTAQDFWKTGGV